MEHAWENAFLASEALRDEIIREAEALYKSTGLTPSQLQARVAELEAAIFDLHFTACNDDAHDPNSKTASALLALYHEARRNV